MHKALGSDIIASIMGYRAKTIAAFVLFLAVARVASARAPGGLPSSVPLQPFADEVRQLESALSFLGQPLPSADQESINAAFANSAPEKAIAAAESVLDKYALAVVTINAESRVSVQRGSATADLIQDGTRLFLVKVINLAGVTAPLAVQSQNSGAVYIPSRNSPEPPQKLTEADVAERWAEITFYNKPPLEEHLSGFPLEYRLLTFFSRDAGQRSAKLSFNVGQGTQDVGFLNEITILFNAAAARPITLRVRDEDGQPTMASFIFRDRLDRIYPNPAKRLAPDFFFQPQVYRADGESMWLPDGSYHVIVTGGPEYLAETRQFEVGPSGPKELSFQLKRWIDPAKYGWYSGDHHIHAAGCSHYENPSQGVTPQDMDRQVRGEHLSVGCVLTWGPCYYYQKRFFRGRQDDPASQRNQLLHYDLEVSGFPSSHAGHLVLLNLKDQDYPGAPRIEDWPTWDLPILRWGKAQGATAGFAHSGWGLQLQGDSLPNYDIPGFDGIGANEYIVDVTYPDTVDFISAGDTPYAWELNIWYQTLNVGFRTRISGETDFPCIYDSRVGEGRTYARIDPPLTYANWNAAIRGGATYVSDGRSHLLAFSVNGTALGEGGSEVQLDAPGKVHMKLTAAAYLDPQPDPKIGELPYDQKPYWSLERARIGKTRQVPVEIIVNGTAVARQEMVADGTVRSLEFDVAIEQSSWIAARILPSSHTNPIFVLLRGQPIRASRRSAQWCLAGVNQCWTQKAPKISAAELPEAQRAYDHAREVYEGLIEQSKVE
ncbi:MAG: CehA/McbA family metallohydrolase [Terriglobia bacterium]